MQTKQHIRGVDLTFICKRVILLLPVYNSVPVHSSLIRWSTGTTRAGWVGLLLWECKTKNLICYLKHMVLTTSLVLDLCTRICWREKYFPFLSFISFIQPKESNQYFILLFMLIFLLLILLLRSLTHFKVQMKCVFLLLNLKEQLKSGRSSFTVS